MRLTGASGHDSSASPSTRPTAVPDRPQTEAGAIAGEYALLIVLIAVVLATSLEGVGGGISDLITQVVPFFG